MINQSLLHRSGSDDVSAAQLPSFVKKPQAVTDGHLLELARKNSMQLVTFDKGIPNALAPRIIPLRFCGRVTGLNFLDH